MSDDTVSRRLKFGAWSSPDEKALVREVAALAPALGTLLDEHVGAEGVVLSYLYP